MARNRIKLTPKKSRNLFKKGYKKTEQKNISARPMRGGIRL